MEAMRNCGACGHSAEDHTLAATKKFVCMISGETVSRTGIIGERSVWHCACKEYTEETTPCRICGTPVYLLTEPTRPSRPRYITSEGTREPDERVHLECEERKKDRERAEAFAKKISKADLERFGITGRPAQEPEDL